MKNSGLKIALIGCVVLVAIFFAIVGLSGNFAGESKATTVVEMPAASASGTSGADCCGASYSTDGSSSSTKVEIEPASNIDESEEGSVYAKHQVIVSFDEPSIDSNKLNDTAISALRNSVTVCNYETSVDQISDRECVLEVAEGYSVSQAVSELSTLAGIDYADANWMFTLPDDDREGDDDLAYGSYASTSASSLASYSYTNDPYASRQWALTENGETVTGAWDKVKCNGSVCVATIDSGIDTDHPDLKSNIAEAYCTTGGRTDDRGSIDTGTVEDEAGHGTHVAGIISASANNNIGVAGISYNASLLSIRTFTYGVYDGKGGWYGFSSDIAKGIRYAVDNASKYNVKVINMSLGTDDTSRSDPPSDANVVYSAISEAYNAGITICVASGNASTSSSLKDCLFPSYYDECIAVGSVDSGSHNRSSFSNGGVDLDIVAPGSEIWSTYLGGSGYNKLRGTSMAAPFVSAVAALCYAANGDITPANVKNAVTRTATDLGTSGRDNYYGYGYINAAASVQYALDLKETDDPNTHTITVTSSSSDLGTFSITDDSGKKYASGDSVDTDKHLYLNWKGAVDTSVTDPTITLLDSVRVNNSLAYSLSTTSKSSWKTTNTYWKSLFKETKQYATYDKIATFAKSGGSVDLGRMSGDLTISFEFIKAQPIYRLYNSITSEHLFTKSKSEYDNFAELCAQKKDAWVPEGVDWLSYASSTSQSKPVYRLYNPALGAMARTSHYYTTDLAEAKNLIAKHGWKYDKFSGSTTAFLSDGSVGVWTCYNEALRSAHHYTSNKTEWTGLSKHGWDLEKTKNGTSGFFKCLSSAS